MTARALTPFNPTSNLKLTMTTYSGIKKFALVLCMLPLTAGAEMSDSLGRKPLAVIAPADAFIDETSGKHFALGNSVVLSRKSSSRAEELQRKGLQVRMFRLDPGTASQPRPWHTIGKCNVYLSVVLPLVRQVEAGESRFVLSKFEGDGWLSPNVERGKMENGRYLIVFEQSEDMSQVFRLEKDAKDHYFRAGFELVLEPRPDRRYTSADVLAIHAGLEGNRNLLDGEARINDPRRACYQMKSVTLAKDGKVQIASLLVPCGLNGEISAEYSR
jgi:hypothetical protein